MILVIAFNPGHISYFGAAYGNLCSSVTDEQWARDNFNLAFLLVTLARLEDHGSGYLSAYPRDTAVLQIFR